MDKSQFGPNLQYTETQPFDGNFVRESEQAKRDQAGRQLTEEEERRMQDGFALDEMMKGAGWAIVQDILVNMPKANIDPRGKPEEEWKFAQLNAFWQGAVAKELLDGLYQLVNAAHHLQRVKLGEVQEAQRMRI